jgi:hypothetical protein
MPGFLPKPTWPILRRGGPLAQGIIAAWPLFEGVAGSVSDVGPYNYKGTLLNGVAGAGSSFGAALKLTRSASSGYIQVPAINFGTSGSIAWLQNPSFAFNDGAQYQFWGANDGTSSFSAIKYTDNNIYAGWVTSGPGDKRVVVAASAANMPQNAWSLYVFTWNPSSGSALYHGTVGLLGTFAAPTGATFLNTPFTYGLAGAQAGNLAFGLSGSIGGMVIWNRALSALEIKQLAVDPFIMYRRPSRLWEVPVSAAAITGTLNATDPTDNAAISGLTGITGTLNATDAPDTSAMSGTVAWPVVTGTLAATDAPDAAAMSGTTAWPAVSGTLGATDPTDAASFVGAGIALSGTLAATDAPDTASMSGTVAWGAVTGTLAATDSPDVASFAGNLTALPVAPPTTLTRELIMSTLFSKITAPPMVFNFTADTSAGFVGLANVSDTSGLMAGMPVSGDGIPEHASLATVTPDVTISLPATASVTASAITQGFQTYSRRLRHAAEEADMPALYLLDIGEEHLPRQSNEPGQIVFSSEIWIFTDAGEDPDAVPASALNYLLDAVQTAIDPPDNNPGGLRQNLGLYGIIYARIEGEVMKDPGHNGRIAGAIIPIKIRTGQSALNRTILVAGGMEDANAQYRLSARNQRVA